MQHRKKIDSEPNLLISFIYISLTIVYLYGVINLLTPYRRALILTYTPFVLLLSTIVVTIFDNGYKWRKSLFIPHTTIILLGYIIEVVGCNYGIPFGEYTYGNTLGYKVFNTPLLIGVNWLFLTIASRGVASYITKNRVLKIAYATAIMLCYDAILEVVAPSMDMWSFVNNTAPINNYISWFFIAIVMQIIAERFSIGQNRSFFAIYILILQLSLLLLQLSIN